MTIKKENEGTKENTPLEPSGVRVEPLLLQVHLAQP
jgi:hypothetical protein